MTESFFQEDFHCTAEWPEWGSIPRHPLVTFDRSHRGEWMDSVVGTHPLTGAPKVYHIVRCEYCISTHVWPPRQKTLPRTMLSRFISKPNPNMWRAMNVIVPGGKNARGVRLYDNA